jgi:ATP-dependent helicase/nuclease subunit A
MAVQHMETNVDWEAKHLLSVHNLEQAPADTYHELEQNLRWVYDNAMLTRQKSKMSVTEIKRIYEIDREPEQELLQYERKLQDYKPPIPEFLDQSQKLTAAKKGTWVHKIMELLDFTRMETVSQIKEQLIALQRQQRIPENTESFLSSQQLFNFSHSQLGRRAIEAVERGQLYKEKQFVIGVSAEKLMGITVGEKQEKNTASGTAHPVVVQGIIDAYFKEEGKLILLDYKTDRIKEGQEELLSDRYRTQLQYYKDTLEQLTGMEVAETYLYSFALGKELRLF